MSQEFIKAFGQVTLLELLTYVFAISFCAQWLYRGYKAIASYHDKKQAKEQIVFELAKYNRDNEIIKKAVGAMIQYRLFEECQRILNQGYTLKGDLELLNNLYQPYHELGLNGAGTKLYEDCLELPTYANRKEEKNA